MLHNFPERLLYKMHWGMASASIPVCNQKKNSVCNQKTGYRRSSHHFGRFLVRFWVRFFFPNDLAMEWRPCPWGLTSQSVKTMPWPTAFCDSMLALHTAALGRLCFHSCQLRTLLVILTSTCNNPLQPNILIESAIPKTNGAQKKKQRFFRTEPQGLLKMMC